ncbi:MAG TPA: NADH:ubiquinone oxidoreductase [Thermoplasmata archaeon]|nr:NADH:ubiquinone oxidoreductase [Thermoplasmata archaeon]
MKPRVAFFDFASCEGCQLQVINLEESILDLIEIVDVVSFREAMKEHSDRYDIAFIEGSIARPMDEKRLKRIRSKANVLVALGACACIGGVNALRNQFTEEEVKKKVYGNARIGGNPYFNVFPLKAVDEVVKVDYYLHGCPIDRDEFAKVVTALALGKKPEIPNYPVCVECKAKGNVCVFEEGKFCLGPVTRAGCSARCPSNGSGCEGCRGLLDDPNTDSELEVLQKYGLTLKDALDKFKIFCYKSKVKK